MSGPRREGSDRVGSVSGGTAQHPAMPSSELGRTTKTTVRAEPRAAGVRLRSKVFFQAWQCRVDQQVLDYPIAKGERRQESAFRLADPERARSAGLPPPL